LLDEEVHKMLEFLVEKNSKHFSEF
jgi:hypothetical protein